MKIYYILGTLVLFFALNSCEDSIGPLGKTMQPEGDLSTVFYDTIMLKASTVALDSIYAKSTYGLLGELNDPLFGTLKSSYMCQFYAEEGFKLRYTPVNDRIDSIDITLFYERGSWIGDSLAPMEVKVFPIVKPLQGQFFTNFDPSSYVDMQHPIAQMTYTPRDYSVSDSIWNITGDYSYYTRLRMRLPNTLGQSFYDELKKNPSTFASQQAFNRFFPGVYITNTFGSGNIIVSTATQIFLYYGHNIESSSGGDSTVVAAEIFTATEDVIQLNQFVNTDISHLLKPDDDFTYLKTPAGVFTRLTFPMKEIFEKIKKHKINNAYLTLTAMPQEDWKYALTPPPHLLILPEDSVSNFFRYGRMDNSVTSFASNSKANSRDMTYKFGNISSMFRFYMNNYPDMEELNLLVVPIDRKSSIDSYSGIEYSTSVNNYLRPSGLKLRKDKKMMQFTIITSTYD